MQMQIQVQIHRQQETMTIVHPVVVEVDRRERIAGVAIMTMKGGGWTTRIVTVLKRGLISSPGRKVPRSSQPNAESKRVMGFCARYCTHLHSPHYVVT